MLLHQHLVIPPAIKVIKDESFYGCKGLRTVCFGKGLEEIGREAFWECTSLQCIVIPTSFTAIDEESLLLEFDECVVFRCD